MGPLPAGREGPGAPREEPPGASRSRGCGSRSPTLIAIATPVPPHAPWRAALLPPPRCTGQSDPGGRRGPRGERSAGRCRGPAGPAAGPVPPPPHPKAEQEQKGAGWAGPPRCPGAVLKQACVKKSPARAWAYRKSAATAQLRASRAQQGHRLQPYTASCSSGARNSLLSASCVCSGPASLGTLSTPAKGQEKLFSRRKVSIQMGRFLLLS